MKCFYHPDKEAVASCKDCGKGLCKECAAVYSPCSCPECVQMKARTAQIQYEQKKNDALIDTNREFLMASVKGIIAFAVMMFLYFATSFGADTSVGTKIGMSIVMFFLPYGWAFLTYCQQWMPVIFLSGPGMLIYVIFKFIASIIIGIPCFLFQVFRFFRKRYAISQM